MYGVPSAVSSERSWAVVTGGSDGIGLEMCKYLAREHGFNIAMVARNEAKMIEKLAEVQKERPETQTRSVVCDFGKISTLDDYKELVAKPLADLDIGLLVLNAGWA